jgi:hypothetical protein
MGRRPNRQQVRALNRAQSLMLAAWRFGQSPEILANQSGIFASRLKGAFNFTMRLYSPKSEALTGKWNPAPVS